LPEGNSNLPDTAVPGLTRRATLSIVGATGGISPGATVPLYVEGSIAPEDAAAVSGMCVSLWARPGSAVFPFESGCLADSGTTSRSSDGGADTAAPGSVGEAASGSTMGCMRTTKQADGSFTGSGVAAYVPANTESKGTVFGALYSNLDCSGTPVAEVGVVLPLGTGQTTSDAASEDAMSSEDAPQDATHTLDAAGTEAPIDDSALERSPEASVDASSPSDAGRSDGGDASTGGDS
jgi:hypothetical protein